MQAAATTTDQANLISCRAFSLGQVENKREFRISLPYHRRLLTAKEAREPIGRVCIHRPLHMHRSLHEIVSTILGLQYKARTQQLQEMMERWKHTLTFPAIEAIIDQHESGIDTLNADGNPNLFFYKTGWVNSPGVYALSVQFDGKKWFGVPESLDSRKAWNTTTRIFTRDLDGVKS